MYKTTQKPQLLASMHTKPTRVTAVIARQSEILADPTALRGLAEAAEAMESEQTPLREELAGLWSARLGKRWRVVYRIDEAKHTVIVEDIQHRSTANRRRYRD